MFYRLKKVIAKYLPDLHWSGWGEHPPLEQQLSQLDQWFATEAGTKILDTERGIIDAGLSRCFGYHLLQISVTESSTLFTECRVQSQYRYHIQGDSENSRLKQQLIKGNYEHLPFESDSLDVVILHHIHEFCENPHQLLREVQRIVVPYGHVIIIGFNPWSVLAASSRILRYFPNSIWHNRLLSSRRLGDWLSVLGFEISATQYGLPTPKFVEGNIAEGLWSLFRKLPIGSIYVISARKQQATLTPIKPIWTVHKNRFSGLSPIKSRVVSRIINHDRNKNEDVA